MNKKWLTLVVLLSLVIGSAAAGQTISEKTYPQQYGSPAAYEEATGATVGMYSEAPMLAERVAAGELPPVAERLPARAGGR